MSWQVPVVLQILVGHGFLQFLIKKIAVASSRTRKLVWQYCFSALFALVMAFFFHVNLTEKSLLIVIVVGMFNAFACYAHWRAYDVSMHRTSLFTQGDDLIGLALGYIVLGEEKFLNSTLVIGLVFVFLSLILFTVVNYRNDRQNSKNKKENIILWILIYSVIWVVSIFSMRYFALEGMPLPNYLIGWYTGSFLGALVVFSLAGKSERGETLQSKEVLKISLLAMTLWVSLGLGYWARMISPLTIVQPIDQVAEMILPTIIGLWVFKEGQKLNIWSRVAIFLGLVGGIILAFSY